jgi:hypothetical protein
VADGVVVSVADGVAVVVDVAVSVADGVVVADGVAVPLDDAAFGITTQPAV